MRKYHVGTLMPAHQLKDKKILKDGESATRLLLHKDE